MSTAPLPVVAADPSAPTAAPEVERTWSRTRLFFFRFAFAYFLVYNLPFPVNMLLRGRPYATVLEGVWHTIVPWVGRHLLHLPYEITVFTNGSGDTTYDYVLVLCFFVLALAAAVVCTAVAPRGRHERLEEGLRIYLRYVLAATMLSYGFVKVFKSQFPDLSPERLIRTYGDSSPMGLLWTFMGYSAPYTVFSGLAEVAGGLLVLFRRTTTLGALVIAGVMTNVVMLNFSYDVPVKLYSSHLLAMALVLLAPDAPRLLDVFVRHRPTQPPDIAPPFPTGRWRLARIGLKLLLIGLLLYQTAWTSLVRWRQPASHHELWGAYEVEANQREGGAPPAWRRVGIAGAAHVVRADGSTTRFTAKVEPATHTLKLSPRGGEGSSCDLTYTRVDATTVVLRGTCEGQALDLRLCAIDMSRSLLMTRGFHWISERPFNR